MRELGTPLLIHQPSYSMINRWIEDGLLDVLEEAGMGCIVYSPLAQGLLTDRYLKGVPADSRAATSRFLSEDQIDRDLARGPQRDRPWPGADAGPDGAVVDAAGPAGDERADRRQQRAAA